MFPSLFLSVHGWVCIVSQWLIYQYPLYPLYSLNVNSVPFLFHSLGLFAHSPQSCVQLTYHCHLYYILLILIHTVNVFLWRDIWNSDVVICLSFNIIYHEAKKKPHNSLDIYLPGIYIKFSCKASWAYLNVSIGIIWYAALTVFLWLL